jgi:TetR/AcrR family transcriptional regulator, lmrAB and yxaGH operons repressor
MSADGSPSLGGRPSSREAFISATAELLRAQGYAATGLNEIVARSGAPKGSLYFHFPGGKEQLAATAIAQAGAQLAGSIDAVLGSGADLAAGLGRLIDTMAAGLEASGYAAGCPIATVALEVSSESEPIRAAAAQAFESWLAALGARFAAGGLCDEEAESRAMFVLAAIEGALILARVRRSPAPLLAVREELVALVG